MLLYLPAPCFQSPQSSASFLVHRPLMVHTNMDSQGLKEIFAHLVKLLHDVSLTGSSQVYLGRSVTPGPRLCSAQKPLDSEIGDPSAPEHIPFPPGQRAAFLRRPAPP